MGGYLDPEVDITRVNIFKLGLHGSFSSSLIHFKGLRNVIAHRNHFFWLYQWNRSAESSKLVICRKSFANLLILLLLKKKTTTKKPITSQKLGFCDFWRIVNKFHSKLKLNGSSARPLLFNSFFSVASRNLNYKQKSGAFLSYFKVFEHPFAVFSFTKSHVQFLTLNMRNIYRYESYLI